MRVSVADRPAPSVAVELDVDVAVVAVVREGERARRAGDLRERDGDGSTPCGQCWICRSQLQLRRLGSRLPSLAVAWPVKETVSFTAKVDPAAGVSITTVGAVLPALVQVSLASAQSAWSLELPSPLSVTTRRRLVTPVMSMSMVAAALVPVRAADWVSMVLAVEDLEADRASAGDFVVDADGGLEVGCSPCR